MRRRDLLALLGGMAATSPRALGAQQPALPLLGILLAFSRDAGKTFNLKVANRMGLVVPPSILLRADRAIE